MKMLMPRTCARVKHYRDGQPLSRGWGSRASSCDVLADRANSIRGYIVINQPSAGFDRRHSGRSTREHHIEIPAQDQSRSAEESQGSCACATSRPVVIDFIDMGREAQQRSSSANSAIPETGPRRIQVVESRISGLIEMSRQRISASVLESSTEPCRNAAVAAMCGRYLGGTAVLRRSRGNPDEGRDHNLVVRHPNRCRALRPQSPASP